jgi:hypothetical protein
LSAVLQQHTRAPRRNEGRVHPAGKRHCADQRRTQVRALRLALYALRSRSQSGFGSRRRREKMPYLIGWMLGVPVIVLVILYLIFH